MKKPATRNKTKTPPAAPAPSTQRTQWLPRNRIPLIAMFLSITVGSIAMYQLVLYPAMMGTVVPEYSFRIVATYPHDPNAFTQGLVYEDGHLYESTGEYGSSSVRRAELASGAIRERRDLDDSLFGEGLTIWDDQLIQLTWQNGLGIIYDKSLNEQRRFELDGQGWGLTHDGTRLIVSDGTATLRFLDPTDFEETGRVTVRLDNRRLNQINELEYVDGILYANVWHDDHIYQIDPSTGDVLGRIDLTGIIDRRQLPDDEAVLNGIAWNADSGRLLVTGKNWPSVFEIELAPKP